ncbi:MAG: Uma2 family endonuclease [Gammaproteobacteria bacterium]|nr:MAG: Uma2 family endonuclease [Gammaproteobacteria bacterium]
MGTPRYEDLPHYTWEDYKLWEGRWELIHGIPYAMTPAPSILHQEVSSRVDRVLQESLDECDECRALLPVDWKIADDTVVQPDNLVVCGEIRGDYLTRTPALIFEVLSKSTASKDTGTKFTLYEREGVLHYVIVDPEERLAKVYSLHEGRLIKTLDATHESFLFDLGPCTIDFDFSKIWT